MTRCAVAVLLLVAGLAACGGSDEPPPSTTTTSAQASTTIEYAPGLTEDLYLPEDQGTVPLLVMVPGGSWQTADPGGFVGLAASLAAAGVAAAPTHIRAAEDDVVYPVPLEDILCAVAAAVAEVSERGFTPDPVAVMGHSSGAHLAALAVLAVDDYEPTCTSPVVQPDALVGLSGPYDISQISEYAGVLFDSTPEDDPATWEAANPVHRADLRPDVPILLMHGEADEVVPIGAMTQFEQALKDAGHPTTAQTLPGVDHLGIFEADVAGEPIAEWLLQTSR
jgi:acetyl esterase/lipase